MVQPNSYETAYAELQAIISEVESGVLSLDDLTLKLRKAAELLSFCRTRLRQVAEDIAEDIADNVDRL